MPPHAMLRGLGPVEREALFAHERAHNRAGHHCFLAAAELACRAVLSVSAGAAGVLAFHHDIEVAQGEESR